MNVVVLIATTVVVLGVGLGFAGAFLGPGHLYPAVAAAVLCLLPGVTTLFMADLVARRTPEFGPLAVMVGTGVRMGVVVVGVVLVGEILVRFGVPRDRFAGWVAVLYIATLVVECGLLIRSAGRTRVPGDAAEEAP